MSGVVCGPCMAVCECAIHHTRMDGWMDGWSVLFVWTNGTGNKVCVCDGWMETWEVGMGCCSCACCVCGDVARVDWPTLSFLPSVCVMKALAVFVCLFVGIVELCVCEELFVQCMHLLLFLLLMMMRCFDCFVVALFHTHSDRV